MPDFVPRPGPRAAPSHRPHAGGARLGRQVAGTGAAGDGGAVDHVLVHCEALISMMWTLYALQRHNPNRRAKCRFEITSIQLHF
jgi:hypothetical protein